MKKNIYCTLLVGAYANGIEVEEGQDPQEVFKKKVEEALNKSGIVNCDWADVTYFGEDEEPIGKASLIN